MTNGDLLTEARKRRRKRIRGDAMSYTADGVIYGIVATLCFLCVAPFLYVISMSLSGAEHVLARSVFFYPKGFSVEAYLKLFQTQMIWRSYANTIFYVICNTLVNITTAMVGGYFFSKKNLFGRKFFTVFILIPMYFGGGLIPSFVLVAKLGLYNSPLALIIPSAVSIWNMVLCRTFIRTIPDSLTEAATIDGAGERVMLTRILVPLCKPIIAVIGLYAAVGTWNSWFNALLYLPDKNWQPVQLFLARILVLETKLLDKEAGSTGMRIQGIATSLQLKYAAVMFTTLPILCSYPFLQKYFIKGIMLGSLKE